MPSGYAQSGKNREYVSLTKSNLETDLRGFLQHYFNFFFRLNDVQLQGFGERGPLNPLELRSYIVPRGLRGPLILSNITAILYRGV